MFFSGKGSSHKFLEPSDALASALRIYKYLFHQHFLPRCRGLGEEDHLSQSGLVQRVIKSPRPASYMGLLLSASNPTFLSSVSLHLARGAYRTELRNSDWHGNVKYLFFREGRLTQKNRHFLELTFVSPVSHYSWQMRNIFSSVSSANLQRGWRRVWFRHVAL